MMKKTIILSFFLTYCIHFAFSQTTYIYVDASSINNRQSLIKDLKTLSNSPNIEFFFSNDDLPITGSGNILFVNKLNEFNEIKPGQPYASKEIDTINSNFTSQNSVVNFHFFISKNSINNGFRKDFIDRFLLCNSWLQKEGIQNGIQVTLHLPKEDELDKRMTNTASNNGQYTILYY
jgi:hypothetical protein